MQKNRYYGNTYSCVVFLTFFGGKIMKMLKLLVLFSVLIFLGMACDPAEPTEKPCVPACDAWKTCNTEIGKC